ncbi:hypothetical protein DICPUDRAFT_159940 [Dictyostelium purpureum]|uniref:Uncharacterized protein n=1 Tax=Dictyostelium purpureum TaxID=5786 RepID=F1A5B8_DICPU|nr:uncharacterized protein DICPUDRAFT_159940 [Dictyostelium purpureum]EGC28614.1 hypothetical protein DICPUDRAFT_159940 [Dictyostelium purpureum]|eukprot:XP_003294862.1 hypothetical protein DICPUDRAFT_159940 [Dictyostelium purpureum]
MSQKSVNTCSGIKIEKIKNKESDGERISPGEYYMQSELYTLMFNQSKCRRADRDSEN